MNPNWALGGDPGYGHLIEPGAGRIGGSRHSTEPHDQVFVAAECHASMGGWNIDSVTTLWHRAKTLGKLRKEKQEEGSRTNPTLSLIGIAIPPSRVLWSVS